MGVNRMKKLLSLLLLLPLLTACAAPRCDLDAGELFADPSLHVGMPMAEVPAAWKEEAGAPVQYAGLDFTGGLCSRLYAGVRSERCCCSPPAIPTARPRPGRCRPCARRWSATYGVELLPLVEDAALTRWFLWNETACLVLSSMGEDPDAQQVEIVVFLQDYQDYT